MDTELMECGSPVDYDESPLASTNDESPLPSSTNDESPLPSTNGEIDESEPIDAKHSAASTLINSSFALKKQPDVLCNCPLHCDGKIDKERRRLIYKQFEEITDHATQNLYIQRHIKIKSIAKRLWEDEMIDKKVQRRVTCKYLIPVNASVMESYSYARKLTYDTLKASLESFKLNGHHVDSPQNLCKNGGIDFQTDRPCDLSINSPQPTDQPQDLSMNCATNNETLPLTVNGKNGSLGYYPKENGHGSNSPHSVLENDDSVNATSDSDAETTDSNGVRVLYVEVCQKAFMNMYGITEKRIRWQREKLIIESRYQAEKKRKETEELDRTLSLARSLGVGCQPLLALLEKSNCLHLSDQLIGAIGDDVALVNNFFHNQLWKPEDIMNKSNISFAKLDSSEIEM